MARSDLLIALVRAGATGNKEVLKRTTEAIVAEERAKNHHILADRITRVLSSVTITSQSEMSIRNVGQTKYQDAILEKEPQISINDLALHLPVQNAGQQIIEEQMRADILRSHGIEPRHRMLLAGPPGNGKTSFAEAIAEGLALPFYIVRYDALIGSYLGETNTRLRNLFDYVRTRPCVLFFDEFDSIGKERGDDHETGEIKRVVSFLLMQLDQLPSYVVVIAATNHAELLDRAVWRRFQFRLDFPAPSSKELVKFIDRIIVEWPEKPKKRTADIVRELGKISYAEGFEFCQGVRRRQILSLGNITVDYAIQNELNIWKSMVSGSNTNGSRSNKAVD